MRFVALLRGINLGTHNRVHMPALKNACENLGLNHVATYVQSGNVIFVSQEQSPATLANRLEVMIADKFKCDVSVMVKKLPEMDKIAAGNPFITREGVDRSALYTTILSSRPDSKLLANLSTQDGGADEWAINGTVIYLFCPNGYGRTKLTNSYYERKLKTVATTRNWKTVMALVEIAHQI